MENPKIKIETKNKVNYTKLEIDRIEEEFENYDEMMLSNEIVLEDTNEKEVLQKKKNNKRQVALTPTKPAKRMCIRDEKLESNLLIKHILGEELAKENDAVDAFLTGLTPTLKTFSPYYLNLVKTKIFSVVQEVEMAIILEKQEGK